MGPEKPIEPAPFGRPDLKLVPNPPEVITVPPEIQAQLDQQKSQAAAEAERQRQAAQNVIGLPPGYEAPASQPLTPQNNLGGRSGLGVLPTPMPPDPSRVPGWDGQVRR